MERLANRLSEIDRPAVVDARYSGDRWRELMSLGKSGRLRARAGALIGFPLSTLVAVLRSRRAIAVPTTNPFFLPGFMVAMRPIHRRPVVPLLYDLWPDAAEASGAVDSGSWLSRLAEGFNRWWLHRCDGVVFIGPNMAERVADRYGAASRSAIIETGADLAEFLAVGPDHGDTQLDRWLEKGTVASYVGNMGAMHDVETMAGAIRELNQKAKSRHDLRVLVAASGPGPERLREAWAGLDDTVVRFEEPLADELWRRTLLKSDIALVTLRQEATHTSLPSKAFSAMAAGCAIVAVAPSNSDLAQCIESCGAGVVVEPGDVVGLAKSLSTYCDDAGLLASHQAAAISAAQTSYDMPALADRWNAFLGPLE